MQHVFGMAKSSLNLDGAKRQKLELDYLRLVYACHMWPGSKAYLMVTSKDIEVTTVAWAKKYQAQGVVKVLQLEPDLLTPAFVAEKARNKKGMAASLAGTFDKVDCTASIGEAVCETHLANVITALLAGNVAREPDYTKHPLGVKWDYYGTIG